MSLEQEADGIPFCQMVRSTTNGEIWTHETDKFKFQQYGWRCTNSENLYDSNTLVGNWCEERWDFDRQNVPEPLPSAYDHYFNTIYNSTFNSSPKHVVPDALRKLKARHPHAYPGHQPEFDTAENKKIYNSWETTSRVDYLDPVFRRQPFPPRKKCQVSYLPQEKKSE